MNETFVNLISIRSSLVFTKRQQLLHLHSSFSWQVFLYDCWTEFDMTCHNILLLLQMSLCLWKLNRCLFLMSLWFCQKFDLVDRAFDGSQELLLLMTENLKSLKWLMLVLLFTIKFFTQNRQIQEKSVNICLCVLMSVRLWNSKDGGSWNAPFLPKNQHVQRKLFKKNPVMNYDSSKSVKIVLSKSIFYVKNRQNFF